MLSDKDSEDRNGDGKPDLWREFYPGTRSLRVLSFDTLEKTGKPNLWFYYDQSGRVVRREEDRAGRGAPDLVTTYGTSAGKRITRIQSGRTPSGGFEREETVETLPDGIRRHFVRDKALRWTWDEGKDSLIERARNDLTDCVDRGGSLAGPAVQAVLDHLNQRIAIDPNCSNFAVVTSFSAGTGLPQGTTSITGDALRARVVDIARRGLQCMRQHGGDDARMADELMANAFSSDDRPLHFSCQLPQVARPRCPGQPSDTAGYTDTFDSPDFPRISFNGSAMAESELNGVIFHEMLHMSGTAGEQNVHHYESAWAMEKVEPCAECCMASGKLQTDSCRLCTSQPDLASNPARYTVLYATTEISRRNYTIAIRELRKAVIADPNNQEAWYKLGLSLFQNGLDNDPQGKILMLAAMNKVFYLRQHPERDTSRGHEAEPGYANPDMAGLLQQQARSGVLDMAPFNGLEQHVASAFYNYRANEELLKNVIQSCGPMSTGTAPTADPAELHARQCRQQADAYIAGMRAAVAQTQAASQAASANHTGAGFGDDSFPRMLHKADQYSTLVGCHTGGIPMDACPGLDPPPPGRSSPGCPRQPGF